MKRPFFLQNLRLSVSFCAAVFTLAGCQNIIHRGQSPDKLVAELSEEESSTQYISRDTDFWGLSFAKIEGVGLVTGLDGTGDDPGPSWQRDHLMEELNANENNENLKDLVASKRTTMVRVTGLVPPGARKGDHFDIEVQVLSDSGATSIKGGQLYYTRLRPVAFIGRRIREGSIMGGAEGNVLVDAVFESRQDKSNQTRGIVLHGGVNSEDRKLGLSVRGQSPSIKVVGGMSNAINQRFTIVTSEGRVGVATAKNNRILELVVPEVYRENVGRFSQVVGNIAYGETPTQRVNRMELLEKQLADSATAKQAALRLEAIGLDSGPALKRGLKNADEEVRFFSAVSLAYLGEIDGLEMLVESAEKEPAFRWHALAALVALPGPQATEALQRLLQVKSAEARYGAFHALTKRSTNDPNIKGQVLAREFNLCVVPSQSEPMIHLSRSNRPEVVLFGERQAISDQILYTANGITIRGNGNGKLDIVRYLPNGKDQRIQTSASVAELVKALASIGCNYSDVVELFRDVKQKDKLESRLAVNALPRLGRERATNDWSDNDSEESTMYVADRIPDMYGGEESADRDIPHDDEAQLASYESKSSKKSDSNSATKPSFFGKLTEAFTRDKNKD